MKITPNTLTISQLFGGNNKQFHIPAYQRRYSWGKKQLAELFSDIDFLRDSDVHLLGTILCLSKPFVQSINFLELVDGQQRITSLTLFLKAIQGKYAKLGEEKRAEKINNFLYCEDKDGKLRNRVVLGDLDGPDYQKLIKQEGTESVKNQNLVLAYNYFKEKLAVCGIDQLNALYFKLLNNVLVVSLDTSDAKDAYKLFETINNRGLKLSSTDIIKNFLLGHASIIEDDADVLESVRDNWKSVIINLDGINSDDFFRQYMQALLIKRVNKSNLIDEFKKYYIGIVKDVDRIVGFQLYKDLGSDYKKSDKDGEMCVKDRHSKKRISVVGFSTSLRSAALIYSKLRNRSFKNSKVNRCLFNLERIRSTPCYTFLLDLFQRDLDDASKIKALELLESFMLRRNIREYRTGELDDIFSALVEVNSEGLIKEIKEALSKHLPGDNEFESKLLSHDFKGEWERNRAKYMLEMFEYNLIGDQGEFTLNSGDDLHLEHIIPQTINTKKSKIELGDWIKYLGKDAVENHPKYVHKLGNFTLLARELNITASNNPFKDKLSEYRKSNITMTRKIVDDFEEFRFREIEERSKELAKKAPQIWRFN